MNGQENLGTWVKIQRSDNRIHDAIISKVVPESKTFMVEWTENGKRLSKEVSLDVMLELNPGLNVQVSSPLSENPLRATNRPTSASKLQEKPAAPVSRGKMARYSTTATLNGPSSNGSAAGAADAFMMPPPAPIPMPTTIDPRRTGAAPTGKSSMVSKVRKSVVKDSKVVEDVKALQKNRDIRRSVQAEQRMAKNELKNMDPGNPHWEFLKMIREFRSSLQCQPLKDGDALEDHQISVCVRKRPMNKKEIEKKDIDVLTIPTKNTLIVHEPKNKVDLTKYLENQTFVFDYAFDEDSTNELVYKYTAKPLVNTIFEGGMATCFAYGQTGSGKTHTMGGSFVGKNQDSSKGIYAFVAADVFKSLKSSGYGVLGLTVSCSFFEIYNGKVFDLLNAKSKLRVLEDGKGKVQVVNLTEKVVQNVADVLKLISSGNSARTSGKTAVNEVSSRSHAVFQIVLRKPRNILHGKFSLVDLAGNERGKDTNSANRSTRVEGAEINKSLLALKECIRALGRKKGHLPFRASVLTKVLRDSFIGENSKTCMIAMISPGLNSCENTLNTLRYSDRVKELGAPGSAAKDNLDAIEEDEDLGNEDSMEEDDDLAQLQSMNEHEMTPEVLKHQSAVTHLQRLEDEILDDHRSVAEKQDNWSNCFHALLRMTDEVDYDVDAYAQQLEDLLDDKLELCNNLKNKVSQFRKLLSEEDQMSRSFQH